MDAMFERRVRERAHYLWLHEGGTHGCADHYWFQAVRDILAETADRRSIDTLPATMSWRSAAPGRNRHERPPRYTRRRSAAGAIAS